MKRIFFKLLYIIFISLFYCYYFLFNKKTHYKYSQQVFMVIFISGDTMIMKLYYHSVV